MPASFQQKPLKGKLRLVSTIRVETGLHIGGGGETLEIGGIDKPVLRDPLTKEPYLAGSSIKGKLRSILERLLNKPLNRPGGSGTYRYESDDLEDGYSKVQGQKIWFQGAKHCPLSRVFGSTGNNCWIETSIAEDQQLSYQNTETDENGKQYSFIRGRNAPARLLVRDAHLTPKSAEDLKKIDTGLFMTEWKFENGLDRVTAAANPRQLERVPKGTEFNFELVYTVEDPNQVEEDLRNIAIALAILEDDALGGHGSRGYGKISFHNFKLYYRSIEKYRDIVGNGGSSFDPIYQKENTPEFLEDFGNVNQQIRGSLDEQ
ncbi:type III-A CRISPR-associated RAMP protein Csm3 [Geitlerinema sp. PCC 9228]|jgi:CRISPR-associated protein Csm3|uniref:type III-A CRISPR-associated RAMP protein Csm3 n=1 Tax=Geitlerinema sp. PCC 9228 TaxID=111611 RepID=UPI0008F98FC8|nr:type III-A CRISPR-associated RAMP protein Csm3 [Geitlerinema sp. PCC 9228]